MNARALGGALAVVAGFAAVYFTGTTYNAAWLLPITVLPGAVLRLVTTRSREPDAALAGRIGAIAFWALLSAMTTLSIPRVQLSAMAFRVALAVHVCAATALMMFSAKRRVAPSVPRQLVTVAGSAFLVVQLVRSVAGIGVPSPVVLAPPFEGRWAVLQGGPSTLLNHHFAVRSQQDALDLVRLEDGARMNGPVGDLSSYHCFGSDLRSPVAGVVARSVSSHRDQPIGTANPDAPAGNHVVIQAGTARFVLLAHLQQGSISVRVGEAVTLGQTIARCGNSGNTTEPHLHLQVQTRADFGTKGVSTIPLTFEPGTRLRRNTIIDNRP